MKRTMKDAMNLNPDELSGIPADEALSATPEHQFTEEFDNKLRDYNDRITDIDPDYASFKPYDKILLRLYARPLSRNESGLVKPHFEMIRISTSAGYGDIGRMMSPWTFAKKAVIVALPDVDYITSRFEVGDTVVLNENQILAKAVGKGDEGYVDVPNKFFHPDFYEGNMMPINPEDKNYGYVLLHVNSIDGSI